MHRKFSTYDHELYIKIFEREDFSTTSYEDTLSFYRDANYSAFINSLKKTFAFLNDFEKMNKNSLWYVTIEDIDGFRLDIPYGLIKENDLINDVEALEELFEIRAPKSVESYSTESEWIPF